VNMFNIVTQVASEHRVRFVERILSRIIEGMTEEERVEVGEEAWEIYRARYL